MDFTKVALKQLGRVRKLLPLINRATDGQRRDEEFSATKEIMSTNTIPIEHTNFDTISCGVLWSKSKFFIPERSESILNDPSLTFTIISLNIMHTERDQPHRHIRITLTEHIRLQEATSLDAAHLHCSVFIHLSTHTNNSKQQQLRSEHTLQREVNHSIKKEINK